MSMKKKVTLIATGTALAALVAVGGTLAWFSSTQTATNVVTTGNVKILLEETKDGELTDVNGSGVTFDKVVPGAEILKDPTITNVGANNAYVRAKIEITGDNLTAEQRQKIEALFAQENNPDFDRKNGNVAYEDCYTFNKEDGYFYFTGNCKDNNQKGDFIMYAGDAADSSHAIFSNVTFPTSWGNEMADAKFNIVVTAEAVQVDNFVELNKDEALTVEKLAATWNSEFAPASSSTPESSTPESSTPESSTPESSTPESSSSVAQ